MNNYLHDITIPVCVKYLGNLAKLVDRGEAFLKKKKRKENILLGAKLAPDMYNFTKQVQYAYFTALELSTNLSGRPMPDGFAYDEKSLKDLKKSLTRAVLFLKKIKPKELSAAHRKRVATFLLSPKKRVKAAEYAIMLALPNFFFHVTTSYDILRHLGVRIGKDDYLGV